MALRTPEKPIPGDLQSLPSDAPGLKGTSTGPDMVAFAQENSVLSPELVGVRPSMAAARGMLTIEAHR